MVKKKQINSIIVLFSPFFFYLLGVLTCTLVSSALWGGLALHQSSIPCGQHARCMQLERQTMVCELPGSPITQSK